MKSNVVEHDEPLGNAVSIRSMRYLPYEGMRRLQQTEIRNKDFAIRIQT